MSKFSHIDNQGKPIMVDVSEKDDTIRNAVAQSTMLIPSEIIQLLKSNNFNSPKGSVFQTAIIAGTMAVKNTSNLIPLCHPLPISNCKIDIYFSKQDLLVIQCSVKVKGKTGVEMEALTGCSIAALTVYDMCKSFSLNIKIIETKLISKTGGKTDLTAKK